MLSFDGDDARHQRPEHERRAAPRSSPCPRRGGRPSASRRVAPSYLHGWSPDGKYLVYTGGRNDEFDIYQIAADGSGEETRLTDFKGLDDGPEYTPDGKYIYFNSTRSGTMQIWRMKPDGKDPEQVTNDELQQLVPPHLARRPVDRLPELRQGRGSGGPSVLQAGHLRLMPIEGGVPRVIAYVYGGQGTINVPSWSPDGTHARLRQQLGPQLSTSAAAGTGTKTAARPSRATTAASA